MFTTKNLFANLIMPATSLWYRFFFVRIISKSYFFVPYIVLYAVHLGLSLGVLLTIEAIFSILIVVFDLPAGHLADLIGPRQALIAGVVLEAVASLLLGGIANQAIFWIVQPLFAAAAALTQGADAGMSEIILRYDNAQQDFEKGEQVFQKLILVWTAVVYGISSALSLVSLRLPFIVTGVVQLLCMIGLLTVPNLRSVSTLRVDINQPSIRSRATSIINIIHANSGLRVDLLAMVAAGTGFSVILYLLPIFLITSGSSDSDVGVIQSAVAIGAAIVVHRLGLNSDLRVAGTIAIVAAFLLGVKFLPIVVIAAIFLQASRAKILPRFRERILIEMRDCGEATAMSIVSTSMTIGFAILAPILGVLTSLLTPSGLAVITGLLFLFSTLTMSIYLRYGRSTNETS